jgi:hypothetical protein
MAARGSRITSLSSRGAHTGQGVSVRREGTAPSPSLQVFVPAIDSLDEIAGWLGTFRERLRLASTEDRAEVAVVVERLEARFRQRRAELS